MEPGSRTVLYHCVCGESVPISVGSSATCESCGRHYSREVIEGDGMATLRVAEDGGDGIEPPEKMRVQTGPDPLIGKTLGHFEIVDRLGRGGMGAVYRALDQSLQRFVALKVIDRPGPSSGNDSTKVRQVGALLREARAQARVRHANVVHIYYVSRDEDGSDMPFLAMELVDGGTLADGMAVRLPTFAESVDIALQSAEALRQSAKFDIVHGDVKPSNILLDSDGTVRLSDFGIARRISDESSQNLSGTPNYMSPEVCDGRAPDSRSDQYSLGVMLFEMTFGRLPYSFVGRSMEDRMEAHRTFVVEFPDPWPKSIPRGWRDLLEKLLAKRPEDRFHDYDELISTLEKLRPVSLPPASHLNRLMAWGIDILLALLVAGLLNNILTIAATSANWRSPWIRELCFAIAGGVTLGGIAFFQRRWRTSLGKKLFQLQVVDLHGLEGGHTRNFARTLFQFFPLWLLVASLCIRMLGMEGLAVLVLLAGAVFLLVDIGFAVFRRDRRSFHDIVFGTKVALSAHRDALGEGQMIRRAD